MKTIKTYKAQAIGSQRIEALVITATAVATEHRTLVAAAKHHVREGRKIAKALWETLPGATIDQLTVELLRRTASLYRVPHRTVEEAQP